MLSPCVIAALPPLVLGSNPGLELAGQVLYHWTMGYTVDPQLVLWGFCLVGGLGFFFVFVFICFLRDLPQTQDLKLLFLYWWILRLNFSYTNYLNRELNWAWWATEMGWPLHSRPAWVSSYLKTQETGETSRSPRETEFCSTLGDLMPSHGFFMLSGTEPSTHVHIIEN